jgi:hypothetical protein
MSNDLDELMSRDPLSLSEADLSAIIAYHRNQRSRKAAGEKPIKSSPTSIDISDIAKKLITSSTPTVSIKRRI